MEARDERTARELRRRCCDRPLTLRQADGRILLDDVALMEAQVQALRERDFRRFVLLVVAQDAAELLQQGDLVFDAIPGDSGHALEAGFPLFDCRGRIAAALKCTAEIYVRRCKIRVGDQRRAQGGKRASVVAGLREQRRAIEVDDEEQGVLAIHRYPNLVELAGEVWLSRDRQLLRGGDEFVERKVSGRDLLQSRDECRLRHESCARLSGPTRPRVTLG